MLEKQEQEMNERLMRPKITSTAAANANSVQGLSTADKINQKYTQEQLRREVERAERDIEREALRNERL